MPRPSPPVAFVLSGGGSLGAIQVGMLRALYERDIKPDLIVATSVGAINGAFIASRSQTTETADELAANWHEVRRGQVFPVGLFGGLLGFLGARDHLVPDSGLRALVARHAGRERLEELPIPLHVVGVDVVTGEELLLSTGSAEEARAFLDEGGAERPPIRMRMHRHRRHLKVRARERASLFDRSSGVALGERVLAAVDDEPGQC